MALPSRVAAIQGRASVLEGRQGSAHPAELQLADLTTELNDLLGAPAGHATRVGPGRAGEL
jgi:hypothetical protein